MEQSFKHLLCGPKSQQRAQQQVKWGVLCCHDSIQPQHPLETATRCLGLAWVLARSWGHHDPLSHLCRRGVLPLAALHDTLTCTPAGCRQPEPLGSTGGDSEVYHLYSSEIRIVYHLYTIRSPWEDLSLRRMASTPPGLELPTFGFMSRRSAIRLQRPPEAK